jgi:plasmid maintenance system antidote protein VapI
VPQFKPTFGVSREEVASLGEAISLSPDFFSKAQLQRDLWEASQRKRRKIKPLAA